MTTAIIITTIIVCMGVLKLMQMTIEKPDLWIRDRFYNTKIQDNQYLKKQNKKK